ncbi:transcription factor MYB101-like [Arachis hypogaea]|uniref:transcription factor MYB101-like n=1 Tax=Arachis hypogaea TaxID=3818 RepID=UPI003B21812E
MISNNNKNNENCESWRDNLRKGPWTPREDAILIEQVKKCGKGNWSLIRKTSELRRSGKSCRLRWSNHLRPDLKKGPFSEKEEKLIDDLHAKFGNKWALMATERRRRRLGKAEKSHRTLLRVVVSRRQEAVEQRSFFAGQGDFEAGSWKIRQ